MHESTRLYALPGASLLQRALIAAQASPQGEYCMASTVLGLLEMQLLDCLIQSVAKSRKKPETLTLPAWHFH